MPFNLLKKYPELLEILHLGNKERKASLYRVYRRDIEDNEAFKFREKRVYPIKSDGEIDMQREFMHLTTTDDKEAEGAATKKRVFEPDRSRRLHWIRHHIEERTSSGKSRALLPPSPLRTVRESFPSYGSSNSIFLFVVRNRLILSTVSFISLVAVVMDKLPYN